MHVPQLISRAVDRLHTIGCLSTELLITAEHAALLSAGAEEQRTTTIVTIPVPDFLACRFPKEKHPPHITVAYICKSAVDDGTASCIEAAIRRGCAKVPPFRVFCDTNRGLQEFGNGNDGNKALWFEVQSAEEDGTRSEPLTSLFKAIRSELAVEKLPYDGYPNFKGHVTWQYVPNDTPEKERARINSLAANRFNDKPLAFAVNHVDVVLNGKSRVMSLNPMAPRKR